MGPRYQVGLLAAATLAMLTVLRTVGAAPPAAGDVIAGQLELPDGPRAAFEVRDGSLLFAQRDRADSAMAFAPRVREQGVAWLPLVVDERAVRQAGRSAPTPTPLGSPRSIDAADGRFSLLATRVGEPARPVAQPSYASLRPQQLLDVHGRSGDGTCCVSARGWTVCGAVVEIEQTSCRATPILVAGLSVD